MPLPTESASVWSQYDFGKIPFSEIERVGQRTLLYRDLFSVSWILGRYCNYRCSYCWPYARSDIRDHRPTEQIVKTLDEIKRQARERNFNSFHFSFSGGEPTLHPGFLKILEHYSSDSPNCNAQTLHMTTNLSAGIPWFKKFIAATERLHRVSITASFHKESAERKTFSDKLVFLQENDAQVTINMVMVPSRFAMLWNDALFFHQRGINVTLKPQSDPTASKIVAGYSAEELNLLRTGLPQRQFTEARLKAQAPQFLRPKQKPLSSSDCPENNEPIPAVFQVECTDARGKKWYLDQAERFNAFEFNRFQGWECNSGHQSIVIREPGGTVKRSYSCHDEPLGTVDGGFQLFQSARACITPSCVSSADSKIPKRKFGSKLPLPGASALREAP